MAIDKEKKSVLARFIIVYIVLMFVFFNLANLNFFERLLDIKGGYSKAIVILLSKILKIFGISSSYYRLDDGTVINLPTISLNVKFGCNGLEAVIMYVFAVVSFPAAWLNKLKAIAAGFVVIQILNIIRLLALVFVSIHYKGLFFYFHTYFSQSVMIVVSLAMFVIYVRRYAAEEKSA
ncbi:MAG: archaeosortase/exosortase family protein [Candidatus Magnetominusculus sp. LBB02]|nr:archaeosortase/exosortase family protein [Candidatus Magnetominusculus sp. LBB02]